MSCAIRTREGEDLLLAYCDGRLNAPQSAAFEAHLHDCADCREAAAAQNAVWRALDDWSTPPISHTFDARLHQRIRAEVPWWELALRPFRWLLAYRAVPAAATATLLLIAGFLLTTPDQMPVTSSPETAQMETVAPEQADSALIEMETIREFSSLMRAEPASPRM